MLLTPGELLDELRYWQLVRPIQAFWFVLLRTRCDSAHRILTLRLVIFSSLPNRPDPVDTCLYVLQHFNITDKR